MNPYSKHTSRLEVVTGKLLQYPKMRREAPAKNADFFIFFEKIDFREKIYRITKLITTSKIFI